MKNIYIIIATYVRMFLTCIDRFSVGSLRLVTSSGETSINENSGRLEIYINGKWGTICDDSFGEIEAEVACQQLGFLYAVSIGNVGHVR